MGSRISIFPIFTLNFKKKLGVLSAEASNLQRPLISAKASNLIVNESLLCQQLIWACKYHCSPHQLGQSLFSHINLETHNNLETLHLYENNLPLQWLHLYENNLLLQWIINFCPPLQWIISCVKIFFKKHGNGTVKQLKSSIALQASLPVAACVVARF